MTERKAYVFAVKEYPDGTPWIMLEPSNGNLPPLENGFIGFDLRKGMTIVQAQELAKILNEQIEEITFTNTSKIQAYHTSCSPHFQ